MKRIEYRNGKLYTETRMKFQGNVQTVHFMRIDTSSETTEISESCAEFLGINNKGSSDTIFMDSLSVGPLKVSEFPVKVTRSSEDGVLGLDFMKKVGAKINLDAMTISSSRT